MRFSITAIALLAVGIYAAPENKIAVARSVDEATGFPIGMMELDSSLQKRSGPSGLDKRASCEFACNSGCGFCSDQACLENCQINCPICCSIHNNDCLSCATEYDCTH
ncbi:hypothetical protein K491DRAFT_682104 [Lophiostoma macrostomum CBS 122681]|uniref:Uncharacterized protein n=1 Tax=Lophiostoma macrostomum CBS 122681 TaxID=1314788 RepID=A0A6A6SV80_9PLEO|nr:hypothetical protein K491DRAFT_682104 [Lophiostoma macrostomum CBS 122681]